MFAPPPARERRCRVVYVSPLKALAVDVERNLRAPLAGWRAWRRPGRRVTSSRPSRSAPATRRRATGRASSASPRTSSSPLQSRSICCSPPTHARRSASVETVIVDEIHALVPTKRGAHLALSLERLEHSPDGGSSGSGSRRRSGRWTRSRGSSGARRSPAAARVRHASGAATGRARPRRETRARRSSGPSAPPRRSPPVWRPVTIVDAGARRSARPPDRGPGGGHGPHRRADRVPSRARGAGAGADAHLDRHPPTAAGAGPRAPLDAHLRQQPAARGAPGRGAERARRGRARPCAPRLAGAGAAARIEDALKAGQLRALVATSSLELGIDMGAIDLVIQIEAPPSVASGMQRIGRAGHHIGAAERGRHLPEVPRRPARLRRADPGDARGAGGVHPLSRGTRSTCSRSRSSRWRSIELWRWTRCTRGARRGALRRAQPDACSRASSTSSPAGIASDDFADLRPRIAWDRLTNTLSPARAPAVAIVNGGTIPDRGLYGVFLAGAEQAHARVGELDEEMVFESRVGETFLLGASSWRIEEITHDRVLVSPAPGEPGKMPFWHGDAAAGRWSSGQPSAGWCASSARCRAPRRSIAPGRGAPARAPAAENLLQYLEDQAAATRRRSRRPDAGRSSGTATSWATGGSASSRRSAADARAWSMALTARVRAARARRRDDVEQRRLRGPLPGSRRAPDASAAPPAPDDVEALVAARARVDARSSRRSSARTPPGRCCSRAAAPARAPRCGSSGSARQISCRSPRGSRPSRSCSRPTASACATSSTCRRWSARSGRSSAARCGSPPSTPPSPRPSPPSLLFGFVANFIYDGDAPLAERRAQALSIDQAQLRELLGDAELRELLDADALEAVERRAAASRRPLPRARHRRHARPAAPPRRPLAPRRWRPLHQRAGGRRGRDLVRARRGGRASGRRRGRATSRSRTPRGTATLWGSPLRRAARGAAGARRAIRWATSCSRYARTHAPFTPEELAARLRLRSRASSRRSSALVGRGQAGGGRVPARWHRPRVVRRRGAPHVRRRSLARLRHEVEPVEPRGARALPAHWHGSRRRARARRAARRGGAASGRAASGLAARDARSSPRGSSGY